MQITHRCYKKEFLHKFSKDQRRWFYWLLQARKKYGLTILNYTVTPNHIHLLVADDHEREVIPKSMQLIAGRPGQEYKQRKNRIGFLERFMTVGMNDYICKPKRTRTCAHTLSRPYLWDTKGKHIMEMETLIK